MARSTHATPFVIKHPEWKPTEYVKARSVLTAGDRAWINEHSVTSQVDSTAPDGMAININAYASMIATIARLTLSWQLMKDTTDQYGNIMYDVDGNTLQEPIILPDDPEKRLEIIANLHEDDVAYIAGVINRAIPPLMNEQEQKGFLPSSSEPSSENSLTAK